MKPRPPRRRQPPIRDVMPPEVPEVISAGQPASKDDADLPEHIRKMLEAAYT